MIETDISSVLHTKIPGVFLNNVVFDKQQKLVLGGDTLRMGGYGKDKIADATDYTVTSNYNPFGWVWDNEKKTYYRTNPTDTVNVTYSYNTSTHMWEKG